MTKDELLKRAKACFKLASEAESAQREREREDLRFQVGEYQWDEDSKLARRGGVVGGQVVPARPMLSISLLQQPLQLIQNQAATAYLGVQIHPVSEDSDKEIAEIKQGLYRRIERDSNANIARLWALNRATHCGRGWYRVNTQWDEDADDPMDQEIVIERILLQDMVYMDPAAQKADFSDARWCLIGAWVPLESFKEQFPKATIPKNDSEFKTWIHDDPEWVTTGDGKDDAVLVMEYFYKEYASQEVKRGDRTRNIDTVSVKWCKLTGKQVLEEEDWNGHYIPIVPVVGRELQPFDGERRWEGIVRPARDGQKFVNYAAASLVEAMSVEPKMPFIGAEGQFEGHEAEWQQANIRNFPYIEYKPTTVAGELAPPPARAQVDGSRMNLALTAFQQAKQFVQATTSVYEPSLGETPRGKEAQSGRAIQALQQQADAGTGHFIQNLAKISMQYEARVILDLMPTIYDRPGRVTQILGDEDDPKMVMLGKPFVRDQNGRPQAIPPPQPGMPQGMPPQEMEDYDLNKGKYAVSVSVGKSYQTRLQEGSSEIGDVLQAQPNMMPLLGATYFRFRDFPGAKEIADILKKVRDKQFPGLDDKAQGSPEQMASQMQAMQQENQQLKQQLQMAAQAMQTEQAKQQATIQKAQIDAQSKAQSDQIDAQTTLAKSQIDAASDERTARIKQETDLTIAALKHRMDALEAMLARNHEIQTQGMGQQHEAGMAAADHEAQAKGQAVDLTFKGSAKEPLEQD